MCGQLLQVWSVATYKPEGNGCGQDSETEEGHGFSLLLSKHVSPATDGDLWLLP